jgi:hypothetical protein
MGPVLLRQLSIVQFAFYLVAAPSTAQRLGSPDSACCSLDRAGLYTIGTVLGFPFSRIRELVTEEN